MITKEEKKILYETRDQVKKIAEVLKGDEFGINRGVIPELKEAKEFRKELNETLHSINQSIIDQTKTNEAINKRHEHLSKEVEDNKQEVLEAIKKIENTLNKKLEEQDEKINAFQETAKLFIAISTVKKSTVSFLLTLSLIIGTGIYNFKTIISHIQSWLK